MNKFVVGLFVLTLFFFSTQVANAGRGCCSYHGGQAYCDSSVGRWVCQDGTYSPTCTCYRSIPQPTLTPTPIPIRTPINIPIIQASPANNASSETSEENWIPTTLITLAIGTGLYYLWLKTKK